VELKRQFEQAALQLENQAGNQEVVRENHENDSGDFHSLGLADSLCLSYPDFASEFSQISSE
jgi:hypothetical protein